MKPKISANKLGEYMTATPARRRQIPRDQKNEDAFKVTRYREAREVIVDLLEAGPDGIGEAERRAKLLRLDQTGTNFAIQDRQLSANAIDDFVALLDEVETSGLVVEGCPQNTLEHMQIGGTRVSMRPEVLLKDPESGAVVGAVKLNFSKTVPLKDKAAEYVATALRIHLESSKGMPSKVDPSRCYVVDTSTGTVTPAPKAKAKRFADLEAAGEEISGRWDSV